MTTTIDQGSRDPLSLAMERFIALQLAGSDPSLATKAAIAKMIANRAAGVAAARRIPRSDARQLIHLSALLQVADYCDNDDIADRARALYNLLTREPDDTELPRTSQASQKVSAQLHGVGKNYSSRRRKSQQRIAS